MDAFFASVEQRDNPEYRNKPLIVGGKPASRGVVAACSYEARRFGIHSAMASSRAYRLCPEAIFVAPRFSAYKEVSTKIHQAFQEFTDIIEPLSLDEAFLDVSDSVGFSGSATLIAKEIKRRIHQKTELRASAGVSYNKFLAKIASDMDKPDGLYVIKPEEGEAFVEALPIRKFFGIGKSTEAKMKKMDIHTGADLKKLSLDELLQRFGKSGYFYYDIVRGKDERPVRTNRVRKSIGAETTFSEDLIHKEDLYPILEKLATKVEANMQTRKVQARTVTLKVKYHDFEQITRSHTLEEDYTGKEVLLKQAKSLMNKTEIGQRAIRLIGVTASSLSSVTNNKEASVLNEEQITLF